MLLPSIADDLAKVARDDEPGLEHAIRARFLDTKGTLEPLRCGEFLAAGRARAVRQLAAALVRDNRADAELAERVAARIATTLIDADVRLTGAEALACVLTAHGVTHAFAYAGTSELALCDAVQGTWGTTLSNGRGDKESAFMAAGASLLSANRAVAILHGARGLTNAAGAVADARRNESGTLFVVGLPSTSSVRFLPPHAEPRLLETFAPLVKWCWEAPAVPGKADQAAASGLFVAKLHEGLAAAALPPYQPSMFGVPQDVAEARWVPLSVLAEAALPEPSSSSSPGALSDALGVLRAAQRPLFLVDDYALRFSGVRSALDRVSSATGAPVLQVRYRRGPMLFERIQEGEVRNFVGWLNQFSRDHQRLLAECDLFITVEDRNIYRRVIGELPECRKLAINSDPSKVQKNEYLGPRDILVEGDPAQILSVLGQRLEEQPARAAAPWFPASARAAGAVTPEPAEPLVVHARRAVTRELARILARWSRPVLVDDSQMFGGLLSEHYEEFPAGLRVFGGHGGFVGGGLAYAVGLAIAHHDARVMCTLGDQGFTNSFQGLIAAVQDRARVLFVVCNNGESVSLNKQAAASYGGAKRSYLKNVTEFRYAEVARALGIQAAQLSIPVGAAKDEVDEAIDCLRKHLDDAAEVQGPALLELVLPSDPNAWRGVWLTQGFEEKAPAKVLPEAAARVTAPDLGIEH